MNLKSVRTPSRGRLPVAWSRAAIAAETSVVDLEYGEPRARGRSTAAPSSSGRARAGEKPRGGTAADPLPHRILGDLAR